MSPRLRGGLWKTTNRGIEFEPDLRPWRLLLARLRDRRPEESRHRLARHGREPGAARHRLRRRRLQVAPTPARPGRTWGCRNSEHIAQDRRWTRATPTWSGSPRKARCSRAGGDRGLYKTTDGGQTWKHRFSISENTGVTDFAVDPRNPDVMYAAAYQRRRTPASSSRAARSRRSTRPPMAARTGASSPTACRRWTRAASRWRSRRRSPTSSTPPSRPASGDKQTGLYRSDDARRTLDEAERLSSCRIREYYGEIFADPSSSTACTPWT